MFQQLIVSALAMTPVGQIADAPDRLISKHGVELSNDGRVFVLFAALNGLGYSDETKRKGPPLSAPVFHPLRIETRNAMRPLADAGKLDVIRKLFDENPAAIDTYLQAILAHDLGLEAVQKEGTQAATDLAAAVKGLKAIGADPELAKLFDALALRQREHAKQIMAVLDKDFAEAGTYLGTQGLKAPLTVTVIPNPLDAHGSVRRVKVGEHLYLIVGPGLDEARDAVMAATLRPLVATWVEASWGGANLLKRHWDGLKISKRITERFPKPQAYLTETLTRAFVFRIRAKVDGKDADALAEDFIDAQTKDGMRWTRAVLAALDTVKAGEPMATAMATVAKRANP